MLPEHLAPFFWDFDFAHLAWRGHEDYITARLLAVGDLAATRWLRAQLGDRALAEFILRTHARGLRPEQITFWSALFHFPQEVTVELLRETRLPGSPW